MVALSKKSLIIRLLDFAHVTKYASSGMLRKHFSEIINPDEHSIALKCLSFCLLDFAICTSWYFHFIPQEITIAAVEKIYLLFEKETVRGG